MAKARLRRGIELVKLANRIESLRFQEDEEEDVPGEADVPANAKEAAVNALSDPTQDKTGLSTTTEAVRPEKKRSLSKTAGGAIFQEVVMAKVREQKELEERARIEKSATEKARSP